MTPSQSEKHESLETVHLNSCKLYKVKSSYGTQTYNNGFLGNIR